MTGEACYRADKYHTGKICQDSSIQLSRFGFHVAQNCSVGKFKRVSHHSLVIYKSPLFNGVFPKMFKISGLSLTELAIVRTPKC
jgi:hypothetical protein